MDENVERDKLLKYLEALEGVNRQLLTALKNCLVLLAQVRSSAPDQQGWQAMLDEIQNIIRAVEKVDQEKVLH